MCAATCLLVTNIITVHVRYILILSHILLHSSSPEILQETVKFCASSCLDCIVYVESRNLWSVHKSSVINKCCEICDGIHGRFDCRTSANDFLLQLPLAVCSVEPIQFQFLLFSFKKFCCGHNVHGAISICRYVDMWLTVLCHYRISLAIPYKPEEKISLF